MLSVMRLVWIGTLLFLIGITSAAGCVLLPLLWHRTPASSDALAVFITAQSLPHWRVIESSSIGTTKLIARSFRPVADVPDEVFGHLFRRPVRDVSLLQAYDAALIDVVIIEQVGWPFPALVGVCVVDDIASQTARFDGAVPRLDWQQVRFDPHKPCIIPYRIRWGFATINGGLGVLIIAGSLALRRLAVRLFRRRRHQCIRCGYQLYGLVEKRCPECGTPT